MDGNKEPSKAMSGLKRSAWNPAIQFFIIIILSIIISETAIMIAFHFLHPPKLVELFGDSILLSILISPVLFLFSYRPMIKEHSKTVEANQKLQEFNVKLEKGIAERTSALTNLNKQMQIQISALQAAANGILITDKKGIIIWVNEAFTQLTGYAAVEAIGKNPRFLKSGQQPQKYYDDLWKTITSGQVWHGEIINRRKNGSLYTEEMTVTPVKNADNEISHFIAIKQDVTERNKNIEALKQSEERLRQITNAVPGVVYRYSINRQGVQKFLFLSRYTETLFGMPAEALQNDFNLAWALVLPEEVDTLLQSTKIANETLKPWSHEFRIKDAHGNLKWVQAHSIPEIPQAGGTIVRNGIFFDITPRKEAERVLKDSEEKFRQSQKMNAIGQLAGGIAHDFNNLLTVINGYSNALIDKTPKDDPLHLNVQEILKAGNRAAKLVNKLLMFSRHNVVQPKAINLNDLIEGMNKMLRRLIPENIEFVTKPGPNLAAVKIDVSGLEQVLMNLVVNAVHAMPKAGKLVIETNNMVLDAESARQHSELAPGEYVRMTVSDTGTGMSDDVKKHLFEPFFTTKEKGKGTGLGLATSYGIVKQNSGCIEVDSELGHGTSFKIYLPRVHETPDQWYDSETVVSLPRGTETILVIEDEQPVRQYVVEILHMQGYRTLECSNGSEALRILQNKDEVRPNLILTDIIMPQMGGAELAQKLKQMMPKARILFMSGYAEDLDLIKDDVTTIKNFLNKPFTPRALALKVREVLDKS